MQNVYMAVAGAAIVVHLKCYFTAEEAVLPQQNAEMGSTFIWKLIFSQVHQVCRLPLQQSPVFIIPNNLSTIYEPLAGRSSPQKTRRPTRV